MSIDPIKLVKDIYSKSGITKPAAKSTSPDATASTTDVRGAGSSPDYSISPTLSALMTQSKDMNLQGASKANFNQAALSALNQSSLISSLPGSGSAEANLLGQASLYKQYATLTNGAESTKAQSAAKSSGIDNILTDSQAQGTQSPTLSNQAKAMIQEGTKAAADKGLAATDTALAQIVGISKAIQGS